MIEPTISILVPCFNEQDNLEPLSHRIHEALRSEEFSYEIVLVDDGSQDNTWSVIQKLSAESGGRIKVVRHPKNAGIPEAWASALRNSAGSFAVTLDADGQYAPEDIARLWRLHLQSGADIVQGWRQNQPGRPMIRSMMTAILSFLLNLIFGLRLRDAKSGFFLISREKMAALLATRFGLRHFQHFPLVAAKSLGMQIEQIPISFGKRSAGASFIKKPWRFALSTIWDLPKAFFRYVVFRERLRRTISDKTG